MGVWIWMAVLAGYGIAALVWLLALALERRDGA